MVQKFINKFLIASVLLSSIVGVTGVSYSINTLEIEKDNLLALDADDLRDKQDAVFAESCSPSMFGGRKAVIISGAGDSDTKIISELVTSTSLCATIIVTAGDLRAGSDLRKLFENGRRARIKRVEPTLGR